jgi:branched-chain amino acid transport system substrate-binding protein
MHSDSALARRAFLRLALGGVGAAAATTVLAACTAPSASAPTAADPATGGAAAAAPTSQAPAQPGSSGQLKIGLLSGFSGPYAAFGDDMVKCTNLFFEQHNGLVGGLQASLITEDEGATVQDALNKARKLIQQDQVDVLMGLVNSANALAVRDTVDQSKTAMIIANAGANDLTGSQRSKYIFRVSFSSWQAGAPMGRWTAQNVGSKVVALAPDYAAGHEQLAGFADDYKAFGGSVIEELYPPLGNSDYAPFLAKIKPLNPDGVWAFFAGSDAIKFIQQYGQFVGEGMPLVGNLLASTVTDALGKGSLVVKSAASGWDSTIDNPTNKAFVDAFVKKYGAVPVYGQYQYDGMVLLDKVLTASKGDKSGDALSSGLNALTEFQSIRGVVKIDGETHGLIQPYYRTIPVEEDGKFRPKVVDTLGTFAPFKRID